MEIKTMKTGKPAMPERAQQSQDPSAQQNDSSVGYQNLSLMLLEMKTLGGASQTHSLI